MATDGTPPQAREPGPAVVGEYGTYPEAQAAVARLVAAGVPADRVSIVWSRLRQVEPVSAGHSDTRAVLAGAVAGAVGGGVAAVLLSLFVTLERGASHLALVVTWTVAFAALGALWQFAWRRFRGDALEGPPRAELAAESYQVWVDDDAVATIPPTPSEAPTVEVAQPVGDDVPVHPTAGSLLASPPPPPRAGRLVRGRWRRVGDADRTATVAGPGR